jgi:putative ABC transport system permease protein
MALGAQVGAVIRMVVRDAAILLAIGIAIGVAGALALSRVMGNLLYEVSATDPLTFVVVVAVIAVVGGMATYLPTRQATRVDPLLSLRSGD